ncbi:MULTISPECIES: N(5)-(carboxyethyl)ornithine synthase [unclassified Microbacterium]|uniref:N(5)-(carboxyethyl)ornithine synthase n=1 Tax=unclassified Microbacterium TaxID=2609290 RepID=UPI00214B2C82|nr:MULTISPECIES: N(5)-(carboxyethyl)ornithine synthase [unclassified Microbacterium]MCR2810060.1 N(5)-(carboxyethyl)ornithine synthase [Microbacterium sp. zg.B185]WIM20100.1 N(5)-(carboxyethyl)ornithine synthase [Microbacterium sp. zg-B185]
MSTPQNLLTLGVIGVSGKPDERRVPLHPGHFDKVPEELRPHLLLESGYGRRFGVEDDELRPLVGGILERDALIAASDVVLLPKPQHGDLREMRDGQVLWGWPHLVQDREMTQISLDKRLTVIAFEAMNHWGADGSFGLHVFHKNNEIAGYCSVLHALQLCGSTGDYGRRLTAVVIGFGATARGAVTALRAHGVHDIRVLTNRQAASVAAPIHAAQIIQFDHDGPYLSEVITDEGRVPLAPFLAESDIVVNCTLQDPNRPLLYLKTDDLAAFRPGSLIVDVSCDEGMGFEWARTTSFADPMFTVGRNVNYYAVDHSPSYLWNSASWEISEALLGFLPIVMAGPEAWAANDTVSRAIEVSDGEVRNAAILEFQHRSPDRPYAVAAD